MTDLVVDLANAIEELLPEYLQSWVEETISCLQCEKPSVLKRTVHGMTNYFENKKNEGKYRRWHCLTCGCNCGSEKKVQSHLCESKKTKNRPNHCYGQKRFNAEVKRVRKLVKRGKMESVSDEDALMEDLLLLRVGMALKCATLVYLQGGKAKRITEILGNL